MHPVEILLYIALFVIIGFIIVYNVKRQNEISKMLKEKREKERKERENK